VPTNPAAPVIRAYDTREPALKPMDKTSDPRKITWFCGN